MREGDKSVQKVTLSKGRDFNRLISFYFKESMGTLKTCEELKRKEGGQEEGKR